MDHKAVGNRVIHYTRLPSSVCHCPCIPWNSMQVKNESYLECVSHGWGIPALNNLIQMSRIFRLCCCYSASQDIYDWESRNENMDLEHKTVHRAKWKLFVFWFFFSREQIMRSCRGCFGVSVQEAGILMQFRELQGKYPQTETFQYVLLPKWIVKNLKSKWRNHKPQTDWLFWNALQWMGCSSRSGMKPRTGRELVSWEVMGFGWDMFLFCCHSPVSPAEHFFVL